MALPYRACRPLLHISQSTRPFSRLLQAKGQSHLYTHKQLHTTSILNQSSTQLHKMTVPETITTTTTAIPSKASTGPADPFLAAVANRRSIYPLAATSPIPVARIQHIISHAILHVPSSFNTQSTRIILLLGDDHRKHWALTKEALAKVVPAENFAPTEAKLTMFQNAFATILFFDDMKTVRAIQAQLPLYADKFNLWRSESNGMHQFAIWTALEAEGLGANLQHYNPLIDEGVRKEWNVDADWSLDAQMVIGTPQAPAKEKTFKPVEERFLTFGA